MSCTIRLLLFAVLVGLLSVRALVAQAPVPSASSPPAAIAAQTQPDPLPGLPKVELVPGTLYNPAPPLGPPAPDFERPYFQVDPLLDPAQWPRPGWFADAEASLIKVHLKNALQNTLPNGDTVGPLGPANQNWTVSPQIDIGYRLPSGFGAFSLGYRSFATQGTIQGVGVDGPESLKSRVDLNQFSFDYSSREFSLWPKCEMKWWVGVRGLVTYFDSNLANPGGAPNGDPLSMQTTNYYWGVGPHGGFELAQCIHDAGLSMVARADVGTYMGRISQYWAETQPASGPPQAPRSDSSEGVPVVFGQVGLAWAPPSCNQVYFFLGYQYEYWWDLGRNAEVGNGSTQGDLRDQGIVFQASFNY
jgi:hypothetical protein